MTFQEYLSYTSRILSGELEHAPYNDPAYFEYTKLNLSRMKRWLKTGAILPEMEELLTAITARQTWLVITEPWCGDAAHTLPFIYLLSKLNKKIELRIELRDSEPNRIEKYLTNGTKSIPILIGRNKHGEDQFVWGPRPDPLVQLRSSLLKLQTPNDELKVRIQEWYNADKGETIQRELYKLITTIRRFPDQ